MGLPIPIEQIQQSILLIRGKKVMLDADLARLYGVSTKRLNEQVKRNRDRFPEDFMFQLNPTEVNNLRSHFATSVKGLCHAKAPRPPRINNFGKRISAGCYGFMPKVIFALFAPLREERF
jgi:hypothetical protein